MKLAFIVSIIVILCMHSASSRSIHLQKRAAFYIANETACVVDNIVYYNGDPIPTDDPCESCKCRPPGFACVLKDCEIKPGCRAVRRAGHCCPDYVCGCEHNGQMYRDGEEIRDSQNPCYTCHCQGSSIACAFVDCFFRVDCAPNYMQGECCPRYDHCPPLDTSLNRTYLSTQKPFDAFPTILLPIGENNVRDGSTVDAHLPTNEEDGQDGKNDVAADKNSGEQLLHLLPTIIPPESRRTSTVKSTTKEIITSTTTTTTTTAQPTTEYNEPKETPILSSDSKDELPVKTETPPKNTEDTTLKPADTTAIPEKDASTLHLETSDDTEKDQNVADETTGEDNSEESSTTYVAHVEHDEVKIITTHDISSQTTAEPTAQTEIPHLKIDKELESKEPEESTTEKVDTKSTHAQNEDETPADDSQVTTTSHKQITTTQPIPLLLLDDKIKPEISESDDVSIHEPAKESIENKDDSTQFTPTITTIAEEKHEGDISATTIHHNDENFSSQDHSTHIIEIPTEDKNTESEESEELIIEPEDKNATSERLAKELDPERDGNDQITDTQIAPKATTEQDTGKSPETTTLTVLEYLTTKLPEKTISTGSDLLEESTLNEKKATSTERLQEDDKDQESEKLTTKEQNTVKQTDAATV